LYHFKLFGTEEYRDLQGGHSRLYEMAPFDRSHTTSDLPSIVIMAISCIVSEIKQDIARKSLFLHTPST